MRFDIDTVAAPEQVRQALTDFSARRLRIWNRTLDPRTYEVRAHGDTWAVARERTPRSPFWVVASYDWSIGPMPGLIARMWADALDRCAHEEP
ncbi:hypothetical protein Aph02nite_29480 [Actinoplanes philippinensis]|uniref:Uncharacterized protein n=1 Tax=Actinoplanes philippinensis TaxID=35752 RepID=A0A1I2EGN4_9ACTN|nr:hypothetical protein [Actinoplanes philippinensis]GIE76998.1 hypothetical protein Aph02nite_29480 [Actinoplanes philippinensis]SFE92102.1 hypothetical protein SAMN05421541_104460 [Actinoplanes philippinensis]